MFSKKLSDGLPSFFLNSVPKSGTNLLIQILSGMPQVSHDPAHTFFDPNDFQGSFYRLGRIPNNQFGVGHIYYSDEWSYLLNRLEMKQIFIVRDLRDVVVSLSHFVVEKPQYHQLGQLRDYLTTPSKTQKERLLALINGVQTDKFIYPNLKEWFKPFSGWLRDPNTLFISYEELVGTKESTQQTLTQIAQYLWKGANPPVPILKMMELMEESINPSHCGTFRKGQIGDWAEEFDEEVKEACKDVAGSLLVDLGYEKDNNW